MPINLLSSTIDKPISPRHRPGNALSTKHTSKLTAQIQKNILNCESSVGLHKGPLAQTSIARPVSNATSNHGQTQHTMENVATNSALQAPGQECVQAYVSSSTRAAFHAIRAEDQSGANSSCDRSLEDVAASTKINHTSSIPDLEDVLTVERAPKSKFVSENFPAKHSSRDASLEDVAASAKDDPTFSVPALEHVSTVERASNPTFVSESFPAKHSSFDASLEDVVASAKNPQVEHVVAVERAPKSTNVVHDLSVKHARCQDVAASGKDDSTFPTSPLENTLTDARARKSTTQQNQKLDLMIESETKQNSTLPVNTVKSLVKRHISHNHGPAKRHTGDKSAKPPAFQPPHKKRLRRSNSPSIPDKVSSTSKDSCVAVVNASLCINTQVYAHELHKYMHLQT